ncbi:adenine specific DNA methylase Mod [Coriobacteriaceae bacterium EMTCatB1]|nr:adenine specific DNA methylase Mod [Coriobacteriaceae bacterium EMTCatB1]
MSLPFQVIETVNESRATREAKKNLTLFDYYEGDEGSTFEEGWKNKLIWGDNLLVMGSLLDKFAGKIDLIYIDPPFATGADFSFEAEIGEEGESIEKAQSAIEEKVYRDTWAAGMDTYLAMLSPRVHIMSDLLTDSGSFFLHCDWHVSGYVRALLDEVFGSKRFRNEIVWCYHGPGSPGMRQFNRKHDVIFWYTKSDNWTFNGDDIREPLSGNLGGGWEGLDAETRRLYAERGKIPEDWWEIAVAARLRVDGVQRTGYPTEKPNKLLERIVKAASRPGGLVADFFCGSGATLYAAERLDRRWIGCDLGRYAIHVTRKRLLGTEHCKPFEILNLGKYERQYWQGVTFGEKGEQALYEYLAFVLKLYAAEPLTGLEYIHGKKGTALVHIGAVDAPVTIDEVNSAVDECVSLRATELHVLGWEWEMGLNDLVVGEAAKRGVKLVLRQIPREAMEAEAVRKGDIRFFELAYVQMEPKPDGPRTYRIELQDFVLPNTELIPEDVREKITKWSDYIDYWSIDWDFKNDTFMQGWVAYRTRKNRKLPLVSDAHTYDEPGTYRVLVKVIDIFGNDTTQALDIEVS